MTQRAVLYSALYEITTPFDQIVGRSQVVRQPEQLVDLDSYLVIWGGEDISPFYYHQKPVATYAGKDPGRRDLVEAALIERAWQRGIPVIGICRGAQLVCAMLGGSLIQDCDNHGTNHEMVTFDGRVLRTTSLHHQMLVPAGDYRILAKAHPNRSTYYHTEEGKQESHPLGVEPEVVFWPDSKTLAIQGHPEFVAPDSEFAQYSLTLVKDYLQ